MDPNRTVMEQHIREATGRCPNIKTDAPLGLEAEMQQTMLQLEATTRHPWMVLATNIDDGVLRDYCSGLVDSLAAAKHQAGQHQRLRLAPVFREPTLYQQSVDAFLRDSCHSFILNGEGIR